MIIKNGKCGKAFLGYEDHGILTLTVQIDYGGSGQGFGGYRLDSFNKIADRGEGTAYGTEFIIRLLEALGVNSLDKVQGTPCRVKLDSEFGMIKGIGHFLEDKWFCPEEDLKDWVGK